jgi:hypothetical protein
MTRQAHWIKENRQERIPPRMVVFDTESRSQRNGKAETQTWRIGCAIRWRNDLKTGDHAEARVFDAPGELWQWVSDYGRKESRTVVWCHNLGHDIRISQALSILPTLGYELEWCNLDRNVSAMVWRSDHGTLVFSDTYTWCPLSLAALAPSTGLVKFQMPKGESDDETWAVYCMRDAQIVYRIVKDLLAFIRGEHLGNWQPTGAGMAYATWRHKYMGHKVLVHDDMGALIAERQAMHTGRAEAWRHGEMYGQVWTEVDMRNAYLMIAKECDVPRKLMYHTGTITQVQYSRLCDRYRVLCLCDIATDSPSVPYRVDNRTLWPVGQFQSWLWDTEVDSALRYGASVKIRQTYVYARGPVLSAWATWILEILRASGGTVSPIVRIWLKHCSRALIGRISLMTRSWEYFGDNPTGQTCISRQKDATTGKVTRMLHVGDKTFAETDADESRDSVPMITGWIMAECRVRLWDAMNAAGLDHIAHVDTDSLLADAAGLAALERASGAAWASHWQVKGSWGRLVIHGPRHYYRGRQRVIAGVPVKAEETAPGSFTGEKWASAALDLTAFGDGVVTTWHDTWTVKRRDPRRADSPGAAGSTVSYAVGVSSSPNSSASPNVGAGA